MHQSRQKAMPRPRGRGMDLDAMDDTDDRRRQRTPAPKARRQDLRDDGFFRERSPRGGPGR